MNLEIKPNIGVGELLFCKSNEDIFEYLRNCKLKYHVIHGNRVFV